MEQLAEACRLTGLADEYGHGENADRSENVVYGFRRSAPLRC